jgi:hypothetical protein
MNQILQDFYDHLNEAVITTNDFEDGTKYRKREKVADFAYCGLNQMYRHYLSFDIDQPGSAFRYEAVGVGLPPPTITTVNPVNAHCHLAFPQISRQIMMSKLKWRNANATSEICPRI